MDIKVKHPPDEFRYTPAYAQALIFGLENLHTQLLQKQGSLNVTLAGASLHECALPVFLDQGAMAALRLPTIRFTLVGPDVPEEIGTVLQILRHGSDQKPRYHNSLLSHAYHRGHLQRPDLLCMFHPGIEYNLDIWLRDTGLRDLVLDGVPVLVSAYRKEEAIADQTLLKAVGYQVSGIVESPDAPAVPNSTHKGGERIAGFLYSITGLDRPRWDHPDEATLAPYKAYVRRISKSTLALCRRREQIIRSGTFDQRQDEAERFDEVVERSGHGAHHVRRLLSPAGSPSVLNDDYAAAYLTHSVDAGRIDEVREFLRQHPDAIRSVDGYGQSALHIAAATSDRREIIAMMIEAGFDIDQLTDGGETPLALAACSGHPENADILLFAGAKLDCGPQGPPPDEMKEMLDDLLGGLDDLMKEFSQVTEDT